MSLIFMTVLIGGITGIEFDEAAYTAAGASAAEYSVGAEDYFLRTAGKNVSESISGYLSERGIDIASDKILTSIDISENGSIYINEVTAEVDSISKKSSAERLIKEAVGEGVTVNVILTNGEELNGTGD